MQRRTVAGIMLTMLLISMLALALNIQPAKAQGIIYIRADGSIDPPTAPISSIDNVTYIFTDDVNETMKVERDNIVVDGAGHISYVDYSAVGIDLSVRNNVTIRDMTIEGYDWSLAGINLMGSSDCTIYGTNITTKTLSLVLPPAIYLDNSSNNRIINNIFANNGLLVVRLSFQNTVENNTINHKPLVYLEDVSDRTVDDAGQVILVRCNNIKVNNLDLHRTVAAVELIGTNWTTISGNTVTDNNVAIVLKSSVNNTISKNNVTGNSVGLWVEASSDNTIAESSIVENNYGVFLRTSNHNNIFGNNVADNGEGIHLESLGDNVLYENNITTNSQNGIYLSSSSNNSISGNSIADNLHGVGLYYSSNNSIVGNNITNNNDSSVELENSSDNSISGNNIRNNSYGIILQHSSNNNIVSGNSITGNTQDGIYLYGSLDSTVCENNITNNGYGVYFDSSFNNTLCDNNIANNGNGISLVDSSNNTLFANNVTTNDLDGIALYSSYNTLSSNNVTGNKGYGVGLYSFCHYNILFDNNIARNRVGILLDSASGNNVLSGNNITANDEEGIWLYSSSNNTLSSNSITSNKIFGIWLYSSSHDNILYHNSLVGNNQHVYIQFAIYTNSWDDGYPSGGNYWSDYNGTDANLDGIGDTPYVIDANNTDNYPLMHRYVRVVGDINADRIVDIYDAIILAGAFDSSPGSANWNPNADINGDNIIDIYDAIMLATNFGKTS